MNGPFPQSPRQGLPGLWDRLAGPGATHAENAFNLIWTIGFAAFVAAYALWRGLDWTWLQWTIAILFAMDIAGGVTMNASPAARRWWHRPGQGVQQQLGFAAIHVHPFIVVFVFHGVGWSWAWEIYGFMSIASGVITVSPRDLRRPIAHGLFAAGLMLCLLYWVQLPGLAWFPPLYFLKLLLAHALDDGSKG